MGAKGYRWIHVQLPERLHRAARKAKGATSWDGYAAKALTTQVGLDAGTSASGADGETGTNSDAARED